MKIYNAEKTQELSYEALDFDAGYLQPDRMFVAHHEAIEAREAVYQPREVREEGGGISVYQDLVTPVVEGKEAWDEYEDVQIFMPFTEEEKKARFISRLRSQRERECFSIVNRGQLWYDMLSEEQRTELKMWYIAWLNVTETLEVPQRPGWVDKV